ncbi:hypothetical protein GCM10011507_32980 [Edaphobacter acidisoli]|uniref:DUF4337 domain-containing protein n=1 Tax=Edaphobacter acidisoli TaxID=2040573 RepID=A0A916S1L9_9BACT|nr:DUF4337 domain-containing protein [Edaphobacter acidisoli]GGA79156.1 hypothetical protein GCM10011507_32980 [Edaphobacter acidisoli]
MEAHEIQEFAEQMKESGEGESLKVISLAISILAVLVAMVTVIGHRTHTDAMLFQTRAADQWNEYQAQKIRMSSFTLAVDQLDLQSPLSTAAAAKRNEYEHHIEKWTADLAVEQKRAEVLDESVEHAESRATRYDLGEALLQIAVVLCSVTLFTRNHAYFMFGLGVAAIGIVVSCTALFVH